MSPEEGAAREDLFDARVEYHAARETQRRAGRVYESTLNEDPNIGAIRACWFEACNQVAHAEDDLRRATEVLNKILEDKGTPVTYTEAQIRAVYDDSGFANTATGLIEALRSQAATPHIPGTPWPFPGEAS